MVKNVVIWTDTAAKQRREILQYWTNRNKSTVYAEKLLKIISARTKIIVKSPYAFPVTSVNGVRTSALGHFSILYRLVDNSIIIVAFWDNRQDPAKLLALIQPDTGNK